MTGPITTIGLLHRANAGRKGSAEARGCVTTDKDRRSPMPHDNSFVPSTFPLSAAKPNDRVLDVGCGGGRLMIELRRRGCSALGVEFDRSLAAECKKAGLVVSQGVAEHLPFAAETFDAVISSVVLPYTDERRAVAEMARVLKPGGCATICCHGTGYALRCLFEGENFRTRVYGCRMLANTLYYRITKRRIPGFAGDTLVQTRCGLLYYYRSNGLELEAQELVGRKCGLPVFLCHRVVKQ